MITPQDRYLARLYAHAFINVYKYELTADTIVSIEQAAHILEKKQRSLFFFTVAQIPHDDKKRIMHAWCKEHALPNAVYKLIDILIDAHRGYLWAHVLKGIVRIYQEYNNIMRINVISSITLSKNLCTRIQQFLERMTHKTIIASYSEDAQLVAGIRLMSDTLLWEHSVRSQLKKIRARLGKELYGN